MIDFASGSIVAGRYRLTEMFTGGEIVNVWKGLDTRANDEPVVLKIYSDEKKLHPFVVQFLKTEFAQTRTWKHPHLLHAKLFDFFNSIPYIVMPFMKKGALREQLASRRNGNRMTEAEIVDLVRQLVHVERGKPVILARLELIAIHADDLQVNVPLYEVRARKATVRMGKTTARFDEVYLALNSRKGFGTTTFDSVSYPIAPFGSAVR